PASFPPGYHAWNHETTRFLLSDGMDGNGGAFSLIDKAGNIQGNPQTGGMRGTTMDWAPDDSTIVFSVPTTFLPMAGGSPADTDNWFTGASIYVAPWNNASNTLGTATKLLSSNGPSNFYYPTYSPENSLILFNYASAGANFH